MKLNVYNEKKITLVISFLAFLHKIWHLYSPAISKEKLRCIYQGNSDIPKEGDFKKHLSIWCCTRSSVTKIESRYGLLLSPHNFWFVVLALIRAQDSLWQSLVIGVHCHQVVVNAILTLKLTQSVPEIHGPSLQTHKLRIVCFWIAKNLSLYQNSLRL